MRNMANIQEKALECNSSGSHHQKTPVVRLGHAEDRCTIQSRTGCSAWRAWSWWRCHPGGPEWPREGAIWCPGRWPREHAEKAVRVRSELSTKCSWDRPPCPWQPGRPYKAARTAHARILLMTFDKRKLGLASNWSGNHKGNRGPQPCRHLERVGCSEDGHESDGSEDSGKTLRNSLKVLRTTPWNRVFLHPSWALCHQLGNWVSKNP